MLDKIEEIRMLIKNRNITGLREIVGTLFAAETAELLESLEKNEQLSFFRFLEKDTAAEVFSYLDLDQQIELINAMQDTDLHAIVHNMESDDAVEILDELPANVVRRILSILPKEKREEINRFLQYPEESCGSIMSTNMILLKNTMTVQDALQHIRKQRRQNEILLSCFVISPGGKLLGTIELAEILDSEDGLLLQDIEQKHPVSVSTDSDQETALHMMRDMGLLVLPVVDKEGRAVGAITMDDMLHISQQEASEDFAIMAAVSPSEQGYLETSVIEHTKKRFVWLLLLMVTGMLNGLILGSFENAFVAIPILVTFIPMLTDTGGNAGSQASTLIIRGLATGELTVSNFFKIVRKELGIASIIGVALGVISFLRVYFFNSAGIMVGLTVGLSVMCIVLLAKLSGAFFPVLAKKLGFDPALMAAPMLTTVVDALGLILFFNIARVLIGF